MNYPLRVTQTNVSIDQRRDNTERDRQRILGKVNSIAFYEKFNPRAYTTYWTRLQYPLEYLEQVGIEKVAELTHHGLSPGEIAKLLCINSLIVRRWVESCPEYEEEIERARRYIGNERAYQALRVLEASSTAPEDLAKAKALSGAYMSHSQSQDRPGWGKHQTVDQKISATMNYSFDLTANPVVRQRETMRDVTPRKVNTVVDSGECSELMMELSVPEDIEP